MRNLLAFVLLLITAITLAGCENYEGPADDIAERIRGVGTDYANSNSHAIDAINELNNILKDYPGQFAGELKDLKPLIDDTIERAMAAAGAEARRAAIEAQRATTAVGPEMRGTLDHARDRIKEDTSYMAKAVLSLAAGQGLPPQSKPIPMVVQPVGSAVIDCDDIQAISWTGWDLKSATPQLTLQLWGAELDSPILLEEHVLDLNSEYKVTANLSQAREALKNTKATKLLLVWKDAILSEVGIKAPPDPPSPEPEPEPEPEPTIETKSVTLDAWGPLTADHVGKGDRDFHGHGPRVKWRVMLSVQDNGRIIKAEVGYNAIEWDEGKGEKKHDYTEASGSWIFENGAITVYTAPPGWTILKIIDASDDTGSYVDTDHNLDEMSGSFYDTYLLGGDSKGNDTGVSTTIQAKTRGSVRIQVRIEPGS